MLETHKITIGTDPELFLVDSDGRYFSGHDLIPGTKEEPHPVRGGAIQVDGVALEFNTNPTDDPDMFLRLIDVVISEIKEEYQKKRPDLSVAMTPTAYFDREYFDSLPDQTKELGCQPDFNAYSGEENKKPDTNEPFRTGAGHIHVGWGYGFSSSPDSDHFEVCMVMVRQLDAVLFPASLLWDSDDKRRELYGALGSFRPKIYGVEYRPLSNAYLTSPDIQRYVFNMTKHAAKLLLDDGVELQEEDHYCTDFVEAIRNHEEFSHDDIRRYLVHLEDSWGFPKCPL